MPVACWQAILVEMWIRHVFCKERGGCSISKSDPWAGVLEYLLYIDADAYVSWWHFGAFAKRKIKWAGYVSKNVKVDWGSWLLGDHYIIFSINCSLLGIPYICNNSSHAL